MNPRPPRVDTRAIAEDESIQHASVLTIVVEENQAPKKIDGNGEIHRQINYQVPASPVETPQMDLPARVINNAKAIATTVAAPLAQDVKNYQVNATAATVTGALGFAELCAGDYFNSTLLLMSSLYFGAGAVNQYGVENSKKYLRDKANSAASSAYDLCTNLKNFGSFAIKKGTDIYHTMRPSVADAPKLKRK